MNNDDVEKLELERQVAELKAIIQSKDNQVESKNRHIKRLENTISNLKRQINGTNQTN
jgi:peptidoglycan hydrolase CwlO-like protein